MEEKPRYSRVSDIIDLIIFMLSKLNGVSLNDIQERFNVSRRTAERMRDSVLAILPQVDEIETEERCKRWGFTNYSLNELISFSNEDIAFLEKLKPTCDKLSQTELDEIIKNSLDFWREIMYNHYMRCSGFFCIGENLKGVCNVITRKRE